MSREEVGALIGVHPETIRRAQVAGKLPAYVIGSKVVRYRMDDVEKWVESNKYQPSVAVMAP